MPDIYQIKEQEAVETPLILFECRLVTGAFERWSTHPVQFGGQSYQPRVLRHNLFDLRSGAGDGIDAVAMVSITLANADSYFSQITHNIGWKGAELTATFIFANLSGGVAASSDSMVVFRGIMNPPDELTESGIRLSAHSRLSLQRYLLPDIRIQKRCPWSFPSNSALRQEALDGGERGKYSPYFRCGYSADKPGGVGNVNGGSPYTACDYTRDACVARGMFDRDSLSRVTRRFGGLEFVPASILVRGHGEQGFRAAAVLDNQARYNDFVPLLYGTVWTQPPVVLARNDGNLTRMEVLLGAGEIDRVVKVVVNGIEIPQGVSGTNMTSTGWFNLVSTGGVSGGFNLEFTDASGNPLGDPYGSMAYLAVSVPNRVSDGRLNPQVRVLAQGLKLVTYAPNGTFAGDVFTNNPAWVVLDLLRRSGWRTTEIDIASFAAAAAYCGQTITVNDLSGNARQAPRFQCNLEIRRRRSVAEWIRGVRAASRLYLVYGQAGLLQLRVENTLAAQQPVKPPGSNSTQTLSGGWPAYEFGDGANASSGLLRREPGDSTVRLTSRGTADTPNRVTVEFQDEFNEYQQDSLSIVDAEDAAIVRQEVSVTSAGLGIPNFHQAARVLQLQLNRALAGNLLLEFETSVKALGLRPGDIIAVTYAREGFQRVPFRITRIAPSLNHATAVIECQLHDDAWYTDDPGSAGNRVARRQPGGEVGVPRPLVGALLDAGGNQRFSVDETAIEEGDGGAEVRLEVGFRVPVRPTLELAIPTLSLSPSILATGGTLAGGQTLYYAITGVSAGGAQSLLSFVVKAEVPAGPNSNQVRLDLIVLPPSAVSFHVYRGSNPSQLLRIATSVSPAASFTDSGLAVSLDGPPDEHFDHAEFSWRLELQPEVTATTFGPDKIGSTALGLPPNEFAGMTVRLTAGKGARQERTILSHTATEFTVKDKWTVIPDATTRFVVVESSWQPGATGTSSPVRFTVPNRPGATIQIRGNAVNALGRGSGDDLCPLTDWQIGGSLVTEIDIDVPPMPAFGLQLTGQGTVELVSVSFPVLDNTKSVFAGTLKLFYWNELVSPSPLALAAAVLSTDMQITLGAPAALAAGTILQIDAELVTVQAVAGATVTVSRASHGTAAAAHAASTRVYALESKVYVVAFSRKFFGSPASGAFAYPIFIPDVRIAAAELFVTNSIGNSETRKVNFTATSDFGLRTVSGGQITMQVEGHLAIQTGAAPPLVVESPHSVRDIFAIVREAPQVVPVQLQIRLDAAVYCTLTIPAGGTSSNTVNGFGLAPLTSMSKLHLDILSVGQTVDALPGRDLTVTMRL